jgi:hypothetical protein
MAERKVKVIIRPDRRVQIDGRLRGPGEVVSVPERDAKTLHAEGYVKRA